MGFRRLVAIAACITLFVGIFVPGYFKAQNIAQRNLCRENLRQIWGGFASYAQENKGYLAYAGCVPGGSWLPTRVPDVKSFSNTAALFTLVRGQYVRDARVFICPSAPQSRPMLAENYREFGDFAEPENVSYSFQYMNLPKEIMASPERLTAEKVEEILYHVPREEKAALFLGLLKSEPWSRVMIFTNMKIEAEKVERLLVHHDFHARAITGNLEQAKRLKLMGEFKSGTLPILVATDVASRGLHIEEVSHVFNWDLPQDPEDYVHRIGRTARAGHTGKAITLADEYTVLHLEDIEKLIGHKIPVVWHDTEHLAEVKHGWERAPEGSRPHGGFGGRGGRPGGGRREGPGHGRRDSGGGRRRR